MRATARKDWREGNLALVSATGFLVQLRRHAWVRGKREITVPLRQGEDGEAFGALALPTSQPARTPARTILRPSHIACAQSQERAPKAFIRLKYLRWKWP